MTMYSMHFISYIFQHKTMQVFIFICCLFCGTVGCILCSMLQYNGYLSFVTLSDTFYIYVCFVINNMHCKVLGYRHARSFSST
jgi:hypothetical protein